MEVLVPESDQFQKHLHVEHEGEDVVEDFQSVLHSGVHFVMDDCHTDCVYEHHCGNKVFKDFIVNNSEEVFSKAGRLQSFFLQGKSLAYLLHEDPLALIISDKG